MKNGKNAIAIKLHAEELAKKDGGADQGKRDGKGTQECRWRFFPRDGADGKKKKVMGFEMTPAMMKMIGGFTVLRAMNMAGAANITVTKEQLLALNAELNKIKK